MILTRYLAPALLALAGLASAQSFSSLSSCGQTCVNNMRTTVGCVPVTNECLCTSSTFLEGIRSCAEQACTASDATAAVNYATSFCASVTASTSTAVATTSATTSSTTFATETPSTTETPTTTAATSDATTASSTVANAAQTTTDSSATSAATTDATSSTSTTATSATSETASETTLGTKTSAASTSSASSSSTAAADSTSSDSSSASLSAGAKVGIGIGCAAAAAGVIGLMLCLRRDRRPLPRGAIKISEPLPGSGRVDYDTYVQYSPPARPTRTMGNSGARQMGELDVHARRYEDMVPRTSPARMV